MRYSTAAESRTLARARRMQHWQPHRCSNYHCSPNPSRRELSARKRDVESPPAGGCARARASCNRGGYTHVCLRTKYASAQWLGFRLTEACASQRLALGAPILMCKIEPGCLPRAGLLRAAGGGGMVPMRAVLRRPTPSLFAASRRSYVQTQVCTRSLNPKYRLVQSSRKRRAAPVR